MYMSIPGGQITLLRHKCMIVNTATHYRLLDGSVYHEEHAARIRQKYDPKSFVQKPHLFLCKTSFFHKLHL